MPLFKIVLRGILASELAIAAFVLMVVGHRAMAQGLGEIGAALSFGLHEALFAQLVAFPAGAVFAIVAIRMGKRRRAWLIGFAAIAGVLAHIVVTLAQGISPLDTLAASLPYFLGPALVGALALDSLVPRPGGS